MAQFLRKIVSQNKNRHVVKVGDKTYDLDLTYLTEQIICMGLPAVGPESMYRNPIETIAAFLEHKHAGKYKIFNLCNERQYDISLFGGACATFPFDDHGCPPLVLVTAFCASAKSWLRGGLDQVVAIHCKAGKGRTGLMSCCLLLHLGYQSTSDAAISFYNARRTKDGKGLTNGSQRRYVKYYQQWLGGATEGLERPRTLAAVRLLHAPARRPRLCVRFVHFAQHDKATGGVPAPHEVLLATGRGHVPEGAHWTTASAASTLREAMCSIALTEDVRIEIRDPDAANQLLCRAWVHARLEPSTASFTLKSDKMASELDHVADKGGLPHDFTLVLVFADAEDAEDHGLRGAAAAPPPPLALNAAELAAAEEAAIKAEAEAAIKADAAAASAQEHQRTAGGAPPASKDASDAAAAPASSDEPPPGTEPLGAIIIVDDEPPAAVDADDEVPPPAGAEPADAEPEPAEPEAAGADDAGPGQAEREDEDPAPSTSLEEEGADLKAVPVQ